MTPEEREEKFEKMIDKDMVISFLITIFTFLFAILNMKYEILKSTLIEYQIPVGIYLFYSLARFLYFFSNYHIKLEWILVKLFAILSIFTFVASISR